ncbi:hypothetical protein [Saccharopolyspora sp. NPDC002376]
MPRKSTIHRGASVGIKSSEEATMSILDLQALETTAAEALVPGSTVSSGC